MSGEEPYGPYGSDPQPRIIDPCPTCGGRSLFIGKGGYLTCANLKCREPVVVTKMQEMAERLRTLERENEELEEQNERLRHRHNPEVCVDVQEYADGLKAENTRLRERVAELEREQASLAADADASQHWQTRSLRAEAQLAQLRADSERLEWLCRQTVSQTSGISFFTNEQLDGNFEDHPQHKDGIFTVLVGGADQHLGQGETLREAIDAARHRAQAQGGGEESE